jgi:hypothetical protein
MVCTLALEIACSSHLIHSKAASARFSQNVFATRMSDLALDFSTDPEGSKVCWRMLGDDWEPEEGDSDEAEAEDEEDVGEQKNAAEGGR